MSTSRRSGTKFYCFSPPIMLATFVIEISLLAYVVFRYKLTPVTRLIAAILLCLALFQLAEYNVCGHVIGVDGWSRAGFAAISLLPALGLHLIQVITKRGWPGLKWLAYGGAFGWIAAFALVEHAFNPNICGGNYIIFHLSGDLGGAFYLYYYFWLVFSMGLCAHFVRGASKSIQQSMKLLIIGYALFFIPTILINKINPQTSAGIPSIMCGFAVIYAFILVWGVLPRLKTPRRK